MHFFVVEIDMPFRSFWAEPAELNRRLIQLPPFRILVAGPAMVMLFFVISGYSISLGLIRQRGKHAAGLDFYNKLSSSAFRRMFRVYIPLAIAGFIYHIFWYLDAFLWDVLGENGCPDARPFSHLWPHVQCYGSWLLDHLDIIRLPRSEGLMGQGWTIPYEFQGSLAVYLALCGLANIRHELRLVCLSMIALFCLAYGHAYLFAFFAGVILAEGRLPAGPRLPVWSLHRINHQHAWIRDVLFTCTLTGGIYLLCIPYRKHEGFSPEYRMLKYIASPRWDDQAVTLYCWQAIGATMLVSALGDSQRIRHLLTLQPFRFLGCVSFSLYLIHQLLINTVRGRVLDLVCWVLSGAKYQQVRFGGPEWVFRVAWTTAFTAVTAMVLAASVCMNALVDDKPIAWARRIEEWARVTE
ncbi:hypothetical protein EJ03DRAFT_125148 [Teratosphaeria nubilosa]|uniref:Acyltransferase 3 domain-containing protein n=1 Tax=Teratosphaeria nubilosa TaxID=161662 RepID=A0A6G1LL30_9PEZI|nr:hypothetical protein EJ03DRAFT_125148 [Teratosphaeria nubilosa]